MHRRQSTNIVYAFKYANVDDGSEVHYTPVTEILNSYWAKWKDNSRSGRSLRRARNA
jgi:hypothetical protein